MQTALEEITPANGYALDLSTSVFRGRNVFGDSDPIPLVSILEAPDPINPLTSPKDSGDQKGNWALLIQGFAVDDPDVRASALNGQSGQSSYLSTIRS